MQEPSTVAWWVIPAYVFWGLIIVATIIQIVRRYRTGPSGAAAPWWTSGSRPVRWLKRGLHELLLALDVSRKPKE